jgi:hypothetical protein
LLPGRKRLMDTIRTEPLRGMLPKVTSPYLTDLPNQT